VEDLPGGDTEENDDALWAGHVGIGVEYRFTPNVGIFVDGRFTVVDKHENNFATVRTGVRLAF
jgi:opacity protein-like surface antigen